MGTVGEPRQERHGARTPIGLEDPLRSTSPADVRSAELSFLRAEVEELEERARLRRSAARRHRLWAVLGVSPGALIPLLVSVRELGAAGAVALSVLVVGVEAWRWIRAGMDAARLEARLDETRRRLSRLSDLDGAFER